MPKTVTIASLVVVLMGLGSGVVTAQAPGPLGGLAQSVCVSLGVFVAALFVPADTLQTYAIRRLGGGD